jgi:hypothetical protein
MNRLALCRPPNVAIEPTGEGHDGHSVGHSATYYTVRQDLTTWTAHLT